MAIDTTQQILDAAGRIFSEKGFRDATVREICREADVNLAAVNYHFGDKENLYIEAVKHAREQIVAAIPMPDWSGETAERKLHLFLQTFARRMLNREVASWQRALLVREFLEPSKACEVMMQVAIEPMMDELHKILRELLPPDQPSHVVRKFAFSVIGQVAYYRFQARIVEMLTPADELAEFFSPDQLADHVSRFSLSAIRGLSRSKSEPGTTS